MSKYHHDYRYTTQTQDSRELQNTQNQVHSLKESENIHNRDGAMQNKLSCEKENSLVETNQKLIAELAFLETMSKKKDERIRSLMEENSHLKAATENFEELKMRINIYERIDFPSILRNTSNESQIKNEILSKIKSIEGEFGKEIIKLNKNIEEFKLQFYNLNNNNQVNKSGESSTKNDLMTKKDSEIMELKIKLAKAEISFDMKSNQIKRLEDELEQQRNKINKLIKENNTLNSNNLTPQSSSNSVENSIFNLNNNINNNEASNRELKLKITELDKIRETLHEELETEKNKYLLLLGMNQDLGKKVIENMKIINENKSEILYLKKKVAEMQRERGDSTLNNDLSDFSICYGSNNNNNNNDFNLILHEERKKASEARMQLEKANAEQKMQINELTEQLNLLGQKIQTVTEELKLEKLENDNLKEIQKSDLKNISKILSDHTSQNQFRRNEELISELKTSLQNTNKINQELANQKSYLEKENYEMRSKLREHNTSFMLISSDRELGNQNPNLYKDDKSIAYSRYSVASNITSSKFFDSKIKDLEESLLQEKENAENLLHVKQRIIEKLKKSNDGLLAEKNKLMRELAEEKMRISSLLLEKNTLLESEDYFKSQIQELNAEICDLKLYQENYELIEEKLEEFQKQFANLVNVYNSPGLQNEQFQKLVNENVDLNAYKTKYFQIECEMQEKNKDIVMLKDKLFYLEREVTKRNNLQLQQVSSDININNININSINNNNNNNNNNIDEKCPNCTLLEANMNKFKQILDDYNKKTAEYQAEINELKNTIEDNRLVIFSLREKCKDIISKDKEILRLNTIITDLNNKKKKKVSFGKEIVVEFKKDNSPSEPVNQMEIFENQARQNEDNMAFKLSDLLKSQEHLFDKYQKQFDTLKKFRTPNLSVDAVDLSNSDINLGSGDASKSKLNNNSSGNNYNSHSQINNNNNYDDNYNYYNNNNNPNINSNIDNNNNNTYYSSIKTENQGGMYYSSNNSELYNSNANYNKRIDNNYIDKNYVTIEKEINFNNSRKQETRGDEEQKENAESVLGSGKIDIDGYKNLSINLESEFDRIKSKYNIARGENSNSYNDSRNSNSTFRSFCEKLNLANMTKSEIFDKNDFEKLKDGESFKEDS